MEERQLQEGSEDGACESGRRNTGRNKDRAASTNESTTDGTSRDKKKRAESERTETAPETKSETESETESETKSENESETASDTESETESVTKSETAAEAEAEAETEAKAEAEAEAGAHGESTRSTDLSNSIRNWSRLVWYMTFTRLRSTTVKYKTAPRVATGLYCSRFSSMPSRISPAATSFSRTCTAFFFVSARAPSTMKEKIARPPARPSVPHDQRARLRRNGRRRPNGMCYELTGEAVRGRASHAACIAPPLYARSQTVWKGGSTAIPPNREADGDTDGDRSTRHGRPRHGRRVSAWEPSLENSGREARLRSRAWA